MKKTFSALSLSAFVTLFTALPAFADTLDINPPGNQAVNPTAVPLNNFVRFIINGLVVVGVIAALAFLIFGGIKWIISGGDKAAVESARNTIIGAIIGLVVILLAWVILNIIFQIVGLGGLGTTFTLPTLTSP